jgi:hypothetical protein
MFGGCCNENMDVEFTHAGEGVESSEEVVSEVHCGHIDQPWDLSTRNRFPTT